MKQLVFILLVAQTAAFAQYNFGGAGAPAPSAEMYAMGGIGVSLPSSDLSAQYYNPANGMLGHTGPGIIASQVNSHTNRFSRQSTLFGAVVTLPSWPVELIIAGEQTMQNDHNTYRSGPQYSTGRRVALYFEHLKWAIPIEFSIGYQAIESDQNIYRRGFIFAMPFGRNLDIRPNRAYDWEITPSLGYSITEATHNEYGLPTALFSRLGISITVVLARSNGPEVFSFKYGHAAAGYRSDNEFNVEFDPFRIDGFNIWEDIIIGTQGSGNAQSGGEIRLGNLIAMRLGTYKSQWSDDKQQTWGYSIYIDRVLKAANIHRDLWPLNKINKYLALVYTYSSDNNTSYWDHRELSQLTIGFKNLEGLFKK